jgi:hypothetical protein
LGNGNDDLLSFSAFLKVQVVSTTSSARLKEEITLIFIELRAEARVEV